LVTEGRLRFDFSHSKALNADVLKLIELDVNNQIRNNSIVTTRLMDPKSAIKAGATALFGEKYGEEVRVVSMGTSSTSEAKSKEQFSIELCGGTHVARTGDIGLFKVISEGAVASGVRRIEAVTGEGAIEYFDMNEKLLETAASELRVTPEQLPERISVLVEDKKRLERELTELRRKLATADGGNNKKQSVTSIGGVSFDCRTLQSIPARELKGLVDDLKTDIGSGIIAIVSIENGKASLVVGITSDLEGKFSAVDLVRAGVIALGGKGGGGRWNMAQAGGPDVMGANAALEKIKIAISEHAVTIKNGIVD
jgi:alanyl-tRNA synthetase